MIKKFIYKNLPNPKANIGFICDYPYHYFLYKNIYKYLPTAEFILTNEIYPSSRYYDERLREMINFFSTKNVCWRVFHNKFIKPIDFFSKYEILIAPLYRGCIRRKYNSDKKKVRVLYGPGKDLVDFGIGNCYFDLILAYGEYSRRRLNIFTRVKNVGYPKFDDWFQNKIEKNDIEKIYKKIDPLKKTVLYLPTYGKMSSITDFTKQIFGLTQQFNLIIKFHHISLWDEKEKIQKFLSNKKIISFRSEQNILPLLKLSDLVISDNSGAIFEAVLADKPIVLLGRLENSILNNIESTKVKRKSLQPALTYKNSIEQIIRRPGKEIGLIANKEDDLISIIYKALDSSLEVNKRRQNLKNKLFSHFDGKAGCRASGEIKKLLDFNKPNEKFLALAIKSYIKNMKENLLRSK